MGLAQEQTLAEAVKPLTAFRYISFDVVGTMIDFENGIEDGPAAVVMAAEAGQFAKPDYRFRSLIGLANAVDAASRAIQLLLTEQRGQDHVAASDQGIPV